MSDAPITLDAALDNIARRSLYEDAIVTPVPGGFVVNSAHVLDEVNYPWSRENGAEFDMSVLDHSRLHESYEFYEGAQHIRYNLPAAVAALENGRAVGFGHAVAEEWCADEDVPGSHEYSQCFNCDGHGITTVGWHLIALDESWSQ